MFIYQVSMLLRQISCKWEIEYHVGAVRGCFNVWIQTTSIHVEPSTNPGEPPPFIRLCLFTNIKQFKRSTCFLAFFPLVLYNTFYIYKWLLVIVLVHLVDLVLQDLALPAFIQRWKKICIPWLVLTMIRQVSESSRYPQWRLTLLHNT